jgi:hypothetical protein
VITPQRRGRGPHPRQYPLRFRWIAASLDFLTALAQVAWRVAHDRRVP